jgi:hypothetical protein
MDNVLPEGIKLHVDFVNKILPKLRQDKVAKVITTDLNIIYIGNKLYKKLTHKKEKVTTIRNQVRTEMRMLATIYNEFLSLNGVQQIHQNCLDMFCRENFDFLCDSIENLTRLDNNNIKSGQRKNMYYMLNRSGKRLRDKWYQEKEDTLSEELNSFLRLLKSNEDTLLSSALYNLEKAISQNNEEVFSTPFGTGYKIYIYFLSKPNKRNL